MATEDWLFSLPRGTPAVHQASLVLFPEIIAPSTSHRAYENRRSGMHVGEAAIPQAPQMFSALESAEIEAAGDRKNEERKGARSKGLIQKWAAEPPQHALLLPWPWSHFSPVSEEKNTSP